MLRPSWAPHRGQTNPSGWSRSKSFWRHPSRSIRSIIGKSMRSAPRRRRSANRTARRTESHLAEKGQPPDWLHEPGILHDRSRGGLLGPAGDEDGEALVLVREPVLGVVREGRR